mmetsp:Transcript_6093/g.7880  ORF Transcript_6093/g.7880 Transcript_6093/m.7880 type:complete len:106 (-) Transcript_6093:73-390(-)|eukprot:CAMPEP_0198142780 /NCGR_PEP_ID=MMETSP1443-20131203/5472_1 /TAXON_ID=186043 /ORGANISM="Entomoneis sp., Strain CCMP2396" /LENGTH=105 /DNA_ID=CAMNT_0043805867 /DNA_START=121 /DNA_END=438 /DNA_ORIENTATION=-
MVTRFFLLLALLAFAAEAFVPLPTFGVRSSSVAVQPLFGCRQNAKKEKRQRNRENMRKFKKVGKKGTSRRKMMKKALASKARQTESEFIAKCFITVPSSGEDSSK